MREREVELADRQAARAPEPREAVQAVERARAEPLDPLDVVLDAVCASLLAADLNRLGSVGLNELAAQEVTELVARHAHRVHEVVRVEGRDVAVPGDLEVDGKDLPQEGRRRVRRGDELLLLGRKAERRRRDVVGPFADGGRDLAARAPEVGEVGLEALQREHERLTERVDRVLQVVAVDPAPDGRAVREVAAEAVPLRDVVLEDLVDDDEQRDLGVGVLARERKRPQVRPADLEALARDGL